MKQFIQHHQTRILALCLWLGIFALARLLITTHNLTIAELADVLIIFLRDVWYGPLLFILLFVIRPLLLMPGTIMIVMAGVIYGFPVGLPIVYIANLISASVTYSVSRWFIKNEPHFAGQSGKLVNFMQGHPFEAVLTLQLMYISLDLTSSLAGMLRLALRPFLLGALIGGIVGNTLGVIVGSSLEGNITDGSLSLRPEMIIISVIVLIMSLSISAYFRRHHAETLT